MPRTRTLDESVNVTFVSTEVRGRRSATLDGEGKVEMSRIRKRRRVMFVSVLLVNVRRIETVPNVELFGGSLVKSR